MTDFGTQHARQEVAGSQTRQRGWGVVSIILVVLLSFAALGYFWLSRSFVRSRDFAQMMELLQIQSAVEMYHTRFGFYPPTCRLDEIERHIKSTGDKASIERIQNDRLLHLDKLDEKEAVPFWLGGRWWKNSSGDPLVILDCKADRLNDFDQDGWPEYIDGRGNIYVIRDGTVLLFDPVSSRTYSAQDLEQRFNETTMAIWRTRSSNQSKTISPR